MRLPASLLALLIALAGCSHAKPNPPPTGSEWFQDARGDARPNHDILQGHFFELNGSVVLRLHVVTYNTSSGGLPFFEARLHLSTGAVAYGRVEMPPCTPENMTPCGRSGRLDGATRTDVHITCWFPSFPNRPESTEPWWLVIEFLHNKTGLASGGRIDRVEVDTFDGNGTIHDRAESMRAFPVVGGPNPYAGSNPSCPLLHERQSVLKPVPTSS